jgi:hypothetical protein
VLEKKIKKAGRRKVMQRKDLNDEKKNSITTRKEVK